MSDKPSQACYDAARVRWEHGYNRVMEHHSMNPPRPRIPPWEDLSLATRTRLAQLVEIDVACLNAVGYKVVKFTTNGVDTRVEELKVSQITSPVSTTGGGHTLHETADPDQADIGREG